MVERFNRTLKTEMWKRFTKQLSNRWIDMLPALMDWYNFKPHAGLGKQSPYAVSRWSDDYKLPEPECTQPIHPKFKLDDKVRISRWKGIFEKGYTANWSAEQFTVSGIWQSECGDPPHYILTDHFHNRIKGGFYEEELQRVKFADVYLVESVLKHDKKNKRMLIKWLGFSDKHNSWIPESSILP
jgi:hypothetical protein